MSDDGDPPPVLCPLCGHPTAAAATSSCSISSSPPFSASRLSLKRKSPPEAPPAVVRVEIGDEAAALREALVRQQVALGELQAELDAERGAAAGAASEAMTMILRLQREKAEAMMEARQFRRYAEEKMAHDAAELAVLEEAVAKRDSAVRALQSQSSGRLTLTAPGMSAPASPHVSSSSPRNPSTPSTAAAPSSGAASGGYYPALRCCIDHPQTASEADALDVQTPRDHLTRLAHRVHLLERRTPTATTTTTPIIRVAPGSTFAQEPRPFSDDDSVDLYDRDFFPDDDCGASDRVYTVDAIHGRGAPLAVPEGSYCGGTPVAASECCSGAQWAEDEDVRRLSARLQALEADRESMRQTIISMGAEKARVVLLKEIAQQICKGAPSPVPTVTLGQHQYRGAAPPPKTVVLPRQPRPMVMHRMAGKNQPLTATSFFARVIKWVASIVWQRWKSTRIKYPIGQCGRNVGLLLLLDKSTKAGQLHPRFLKKI